MSPAGQFPVPKDVRVTRDFELVGGQDEIIRRGFALADLTKTVDPGEWMKLTIVSGVAKATKIVVGDTNAAPALAARVSWTLYRPGDPFGGQSDAVATGQADLLSGTYEAKTKLYVTATSYVPGMLLIPVFDATTSRGVLDGVTVASATIRQLQAAVGKVVQVAGGVLYYEAPAL